MVSDANKSVEDSFVLSVAVVEQKTDTNREILENSADDLRGDLKVSNASGINQHDNGIEVLGDVGRGARIHRRSIEWLYILCPSGVTRISLQVVDEENVVGIDLNSNCVVSRCIGAGQNLEDILAFDVQLLQLIELLDFIRQNVEDAIPKSINEHYIMC